MDLGKVLQTNNVPYGTTFHCLSSLTAPHNRTCTATCRLTRLLVFRDGLDPFVLPGSRCTLDLSEGFLSSRLIDHTIVVFNT